MKKLILFLILFLALAGTAVADLSDDFHNSTMSGYIIGGNATLLIENISIYAPTDQEVLGIPLTFARYKYVLIDGKNMVDDVLLIGHIGNYDPDKNNTWYLYLRQIDEPFNTGSTGILYDAARHWLGEDAPPIYIGAGVMEGGNLMYSLLGEWEFTPGYLVGADVFMTMESWLNPDSREGKVYVKHKTDPEGKTYVEAFIYNISGQNYLGAGVGFSF